MTKSCKRRSKIAVGAGQLLRHLLRILDQSVMFSCMRTNDQASSPVLGARLRQLRLSKELSLKDLAQLTGSSASAIHRYESGWDRFEVRTLRRLAAALGAELTIRLDPMDSCASGPVPGDASAPDRVREALAPLFWDTDLHCEHLSEYPQWVLRRVLEDGDREQHRIARTFFGDEAVRQALQHRSASPRVRRYWDVVLGEEECLA
jgi:transcriptional regulator with XRE-family HTH domain